MAGQRTPPALGLLLLGGFLCSSPSPAADRLVLRNLDVIADRTVTRFDEDGVELDNQRVLGWDEIERGRVSAEQQPAFDRLLKELGEDLYRIRQRLSVGDLAALAPQAESLYPRYAGRSSPTAYMICQSLMWARLAQGQREASVEPYLRCFEYLRGTPSGKLALPGERRLACDFQTGISPDLLPIWFDASAAKAVLPGVLKTVGEMRQPRPEGTRIYYATLAIAAGEVEAGLRVLGGIQSQQKALEELRQIVLTQAEVATGRVGPAAQGLIAALDRMEANNRPLALYWLGMAHAKSADPLLRQTAQLRLLQLPALYEKQHPDLAAAGLYQTLQTFLAAGESVQAAAIRRELLDRYGRTYHAGLIRAELNRQGDR